MVLLVKDAFMLLNDSLTSTVANNIQKLASSTGVH